MKGLSWRSLQASKRSTTIACLLLAAAALLGGCGPTVLVTRGTRHKPPRPKDCAIDFSTTLDSQSAALRYQLVGQVEVRDIDRPGSPKVRELVREHACLLGGQLVVPAADARDNAEMYLVLGDRRDGSLTIGEVMRTGSAGLHAVAKDETTVDEVRVAVFDIVDRANGLTERGVGKVTDHLARTLERRPGFHVIERSTLRRQLARQPSSCNDTTCQLAVGRALGADKALATKLMSVGGGCSLVGFLYDVRSGATDRDATIPSSCSTNFDLLRRIEVLVNKLVR